MKCTGVVMRRNFCSLLFLLCSFFVFGCAASGTTSSSGELAAATSVTTVGQKAEVLRVVDGDTIDVRVALGYNVLVKLRIRVYGVDTPETYGRKKASDEYKAGMVATQYVLDWVAKHGEAVHICGNHGTGKYGRWLLELCANDTNLSTLLVSSGNAKEYFGGKR